MEENIKNLSEIINLCKEEIENSNENTTAILDLQDLKSLRNMLVRYKELEKKLSDIQDYILINGIDTRLKTAVEIQVKNQHEYQHQLQVEELKREIVNMDKEIADREKSHMDLYNDFKDYKRNSIPTSVIQKKIEEVNNSNGYSPVNKIFIEKVLNEILEEGRK